MNRKIKQLLIDCKAFLEPHKVAWNDAEQLTQRIEKAFKEDAYSTKHTNHIREVVCDYYGVTLEQIHSKTRRTEIVVPRQIICHLLREYTPLGIEDIGLQVNRHYSTVLHALETIDNYRETDKVFAATYILIEEML
jgi:chromosomal replication initiation ATPase DnaA|tara:strand:- start:721 stop:1128 length:408 start_codon:yes stop_codon:yes gene_type:complete